MRHNLLTRLTKIETLRGLRTVRCCSAFIPSLGFSSFSTLEEAEASTCHCIKVVCPEEAGDADTWQAQYAQWEQGDRAQWTSS